MNVPQEGEVITLKPKTRKGKNGLQNRTNCWRVHEIRDSVMCLNNDRGAFLIELNEDHSPTERFPNVKWITLPTDKDFEWEKHELGNS